MPAKKVPVLKVIGIVWLIFATLYVAYSEYHRLTNVVAMNAYNRGLQDTANRVIQNAQTCKPVPIITDSGRVEVIALSCLRVPSNDSGSEQ